MLGVGVGDGVRKTGLPGLCRTRSPCVTWVRFPLALRFSCFFKRRRLIASNLSAPLLVVLQNMASQAQPVRCEQKDRRWVRGEELGGRGVLRDGGGVPGPEGRGESCLPEGPPSVGSKETQPWSSVGGARPTLFTGGFVSFL